MKNDKGNEENSEKIILKIILKNDDNSEGKNINIIIMGNNSNKQKKVEQFIDTRFKSIKRYCNEVYGEITVLEDKTFLLLYALIEKKIQDPQCFESLLKERAIYQNLVRLEKYDSYGVDWCSKTRKYYLIVQYFENSLEKEIFKRMEQSKYFTKKQLINIFYQLITLLKCFPYYDFMYISNKFFLITQQYSVKIIEEGLTAFGNQKKFYQMPLSEDSFRKYLFLAPEVMQLLESQQKSEAFRENKRQSSRIFSLGICFLEMAMLIDASNFYNFDTFKVDYKAITQFLPFIKNIYDTQIYEIIDGMLAINPQRRYSINQIQNFLKQRRPLTHTKSLSEPYYGYIHRINSVQINFNNNNSRSSVNQIKQERQ